MDFEMFLASLSAMGNDDLDLQPHDGQGMTTLRRAIHEVLEREHAAVIAALPTVPSQESSAILALANHAWGDLKGLLLGLSAPVLDESPATGSWSIRQTLAHLGRTERTYVAAIRYAVGRSAAEPTLMPDRLRPVPAPDDAAGDTRTMVAWFDRLHGQSNDVCRRLGGEDLDRLSIWSYHEVDVRFRLHRIGSHLIEHGIQCETIVEALGVPLSDAARLARRISAARALHQEISGPPVCDLLNRSHAATLKRVPVTNSYR